MKKSTKILLGIVTIWPAVYMFLFFVGIMLMMFLLPSEAGSTAGQPQSPLVPIGFLGFFAIHMLTILLIMGLIAFYIVRVFKTPLDEAMKIMWTVLICMFGVFAMPVFWFMYIWREPPALMPRPASLPHSQASDYTNASEWSQREHEFNPQKPPDWR